MKRFAAALSEHPVPAMAVGEVVGEVVEAVGEAPDLAILFVTTAHAGAIDDIVAAVRSTLRPTALIGCTAESVAANGREVEGEAAVVLWAGHTGPVTTLRTEVLRTPDGFALAGWEGLPASGASGLVLLADPFSFPPDLLVERVHGTGPGTPVVGGMASGARGPGGNRLVVDGEILTAGAVGVFLPAELRVRTVVSQGCRPIGRPYVVTKASGNLLEELAGKPAMDRLQALFAGSGTDDRRLLAEGVHIGRVIDEHKADFGRGDFLVRNVLGADRATGAIAVGDELEVGATVQFHVRDASTADEDLRTMLAGERADGADGALLFTCNGRGTRLFGEPDHDAGVIDELLDRVPLAGFFAAGELGPIGGRTFLHGFTASVALFA